MWLLQWPKAPVLVHPSGVTVFTGPKQYHIYRKHFLKFLLYFWNIEKIWGILKEKISFIS